MTDERETAPQTTQWCLGLPLAAEEPLTAEEQTVLRREKTRSRLGCCGLALAAPLVVVAFFIGLYVATEYIHNINLVGWSMLVVGIVLVGLVRSAATGLSQRAINATDDIKAGIKLRFAGVIPPYALDDPSALKLVKRQAIQRDSTAVQELVILPASQRVWSANGKRIRHYITATCGITTNPPEYSRIAAEWLDPVSGNDDVELSSGQRELSVEEKAEMRTIQRQLWTQPLSSAIIFTFWSIMIISQCVINGRWPQGGGGIFSSILLFFGVISDYWLYIQVISALQLRRDIQHGVVLILRTQHAGANKAEESDAEPVDHVFEVLPVSKMIWTVDFAPSPWRKMNVRIGIKKQKFWQI